MQNPNPSPNPSPAPHPELRAADVAYAIFAGLAASLVGIGLARFAYTPLIPPLIGAHWFAANDVVYLGAANLAGYFAGALAGRPLARHVSAAHTLRAMMLLIALSFFACAWPLSVAWFFAWRFLSGLAGGVIMVLVAGTVLPHIPPQRRGVASGAIFLGLGLGIAGSGTLVPLLLEGGLRQTWLGLGAVSLALTLLAWFGWPASPTPVAKPSPAAGPATKVRLPAAMRAVYAQYGLMAVGVVPTMVFLADYIARGLGWGAHMGAMFWVLYGVGAIAGPMLCGWLADRLGFAVVTRGALASQVVAVAVLAGLHQPWALAIATVLIGAFPPAAVPVTLGRIHELVPADGAAQGAAWSRATTMFALMQALAGYAYSYLFAASHGEHRLAFAIAVAAFALALAIDLAWIRTKAVRHAHAVGRPTAAGVAAR